MGGKYTKLSINYHTGIQYNKWPCYIPNGHKIYQHFPFQDPPKITKIVIFGLKIYHLATLVSNDLSSVLACIKVKWVSNASLTKTEILNGPTHLRLRLVEVCFSFYIQIKLSWMFFMIFHSGSFSCKILKLNLMSLFVCYKNIFFLSSNFCTQV
jgi:hypothetical protein